MDLDHSDHLDQLDQLDQLEALKFNLRLQDPLRLQRAIAIFNEISKWQVVFSRTVNNKLQDVKLWRGVTKEPETHQVYQKFLAKDIFSKIRLCEAKGAPICTVLQALYDESCFNSIFQNAQPNASLQEDQSQPKDSESEPIPACTEAQKELETLQYCKIISFKVAYSPNFTEWIEGKTFNGIEIRWLQFNGVQLNGGSVWQNSNESYDPYQCPEHLFDKYVQVLQLASKEFHASRTWKEMAQLEPNLLVFSPVIRLISERAGFLLGEKIYFPETVPWEQLAEKGVVVKK